MGNCSSATHQGSTGVPPALIKSHTWGTDLSGTLQGAGGVGGLLLTRTTTPATSAHFHYDGNGNVTTITDGTGATAATYRYDAFGNTLQATGTYAVTNRYQFSTKPLDDAVAGSQLHYYGYRYYIAPLGTWPSRDPIEEHGGLNLYGFVGNVPTKSWDYLGMYCCGGKEYDSKTEGCCTDAKTSPSGGKVYNKKHNVAMAVCGGQAMLGKRENYMNWRE